MRRSIGLPTPGVNPHLVIFHVSHAYKMTDLTFVVSNRILVSKCMGQHNAEQCGPSSILRIRTEQEAQNCTHTSSGGKFD